MRTRITISIDADVDEEHATEMQAHLKDLQNPVTATRSLLRMVFGDLEKTHNWDVDTDFRVMKG